MNRDTYRQDAKLRFVIKAIYTLAHGLHKMQQSICGVGTEGMCGRLVPFNGSLFKVRSDEMNKNISPYYTPIRLYLTSTIP